MVPAIVVVAPIFPIVPTVAMPMIVVTIVMAAANDLLVIAFAAEMIVHPAMIRVVEVGPGFIDDYLVTVIEIEVAVAGRHVIGENPTTSVLINELVFGDVVVRLDVGNVIILDMIIAGGAPGGLDANVDGKLDLCTCRVGEGNAAKEGASQ